MTNNLNVNWFLLSKLFLKRVLSSPLLLREYDASQNYGEWVVSWETIFHCIVLHWITLCCIKLKFGLHSIVIGVLRIVSYHIASVVASYVSLHLHAFIRCFYPKQLTVHSGYTFIVKMCVPWELNLQPFALLMQCSTTEPQEQRMYL